MSDTGNDDLFVQQMDQLRDKVEADYNARIAGYRELNRFAVEAGATIPLLQSVQTLARKKNLAYTNYANGWILASTMKWT